MSRTSKLLSILFYKIRITPDQIIELRLFKRLFPHIVIIAKNDDAHIKISFRYLREKILREVLIGSGFNITKEAVGETMIPLDSENDIFKYNLYRGGD